MFEDNSYKAHDDHKNLFEARQKSLERDYSNQLLSNLDEARRKKRKKHDLPRTPFGSPPPQPHPPPPSAGASGALGSGALSSSKTAASTPQSMAWTTSDTRYESVGFAATQETSPTDYLMNDDSILDEQVHLSDDEDTGNDHLPKADMREYRWKPLPKEENQQLMNLLGPFLLPMCQMLRTTGLLHWFQPMPALSISKMKVARYPDFRLELLVLEQMWIDEVCTYDISAAYGISHWRIKAFSRYRYDYLSEIVLRIADFQEHKIAEKDFKNLYHSDFKDMNLLLLQDLQLGTESYQTQLNLTKPGWDAKGFEFKHDYTIIESPRAVVFPVNNNKQKIMRLNEMYKFSDGTLTRILEALDLIVKEYRVNRFNPGMNTRFWTDKDGTRSKEFIHAIERRLKTRRIFQNLECFVGGRVQVKMKMEIPRSSGVYFITACSYSTDTSKGLMKVQVAMAGVDRDKDAEKEETRRIL
nr:hypothetical protein [Tanacetum cinerariifolium]